MINERAILDAIGATRHSTVDECLEAHGTFVRTLIRLPASQMNRFRSEVQRDLGVPLFPESSTDQVMRQLMQEQMTLDGAWSSYFWTPH
jgi:hypothetical protein